MTIEDVPTVEDRFHIHCSTDVQPKANRWPFGILRLFKCVQVIIIFQDDDIYDIFSQRIFRPLLVASLGVILFKTKWGYPLHKWHITSIQWLGGSDLELWVFIFPIKWGAKELPGVSQPHTRLITPLTNNLSPAR